MNQSAWMAGVPQAQSQLASSYPQTFGTGSAASYGANTFQGVAWMDPSSSLWMGFGSGLTGLCNGLAKFSWPGNGALTFCCTVAEQFVSLLSCWN
jgi:hypothetical protein